MDSNEIPTGPFENHRIENALDLLVFSERSKSGNSKRSWGPVEVITGPWMGNWKLDTTIHKNTRT